MRSFKGLFLLGLLSILLAGCISIPIGDGKLKLGTDGISVVDEEGGEHSFGFDNDSEELTFKTVDADGNETDVAFGTDLELPDSFPSEIPVPKDANIITSMDLPDGMTVSYVIESDFDLIEKMYKDFANSKLTDLERQEFEVEGLGNVTYSGKMGEGFVSIVINKRPDELEGVVLVTIVLD